MSDPKTPAPPKALAIVRTTKVKTMAGLKGLSDHNSRNAAQGTEHATNEQALFGGGSILLGGQADAVAAFEERAATLGAAKARPGQVVAIEFFMSVSREWFDAATPEERDQWAARSVAFVSKKMGAENILSAHLHDDESTPHVSIITAPFRESARKKAGRPRKGREAAPRATEQGWALSADSFIGGSKHNHIQLQTDYAAQLADLGVKRGVPKKETGARNRSPGQWRAQMAQDADALRDLTDAARDDNNAAMLRSAKITGDAHTDARQVIKSAQATAAGFALGLEAIDRREIIHQPATAERAETLARVPVPAPLLPQDPEELKGWRRAVEPVWGALVGYARRLAGLQERERQVVEAAAQNTKDAQAIENTARRQALAEATRSGWGPAQIDHETIKKAAQRGRLPGANEAR